jgi:outer membrane protein OmpA-like peptidoglycan-associated protein
MRSVVCLLFLVWGVYGSAQSDTSAQELPFEFPLIIRYQNNSAAISHVNRLRLSILADYLKEVPSKKIRIEGHVCCGPDMRVSKKRAKRVYKMLRKLGVPKEQMTYIGRSFDEPKVPKEKNETDKDMNRRVEIELLSF